jgi:hypothetical protein
VIVSQPFYSFGVDKVCLFVNLKEEIFYSEKNSLAFYLDGGVMAFSLSWSVERVGWFLKQIKNIFSIKWPRLELNRLNK